MTVDFKTLAAALKVSKRAVEMRAKRESWLFTEEDVNGGKRKLFAIATLPKYIQNALAAQIKSEAREVDAAIIAQVRAQTAAEKKAKIARGETNLHKLMVPLSSTVQARFDARYDIVASWERFYIATCPLNTKKERPGKKKSYGHYAHAYNAKELSGACAISAAVQAQFPVLSARTVERWVHINETEGMTGLIDHRDGKAQANKNVFTQQPLLEKTVIALLLDKPHLSIVAINTLLQAASVDQDTGEVLFETPRYDTTCRFVGRWKETNAELFTAATNPDEWKNKYMVAYGDADEEVVRLNQRWEMDATPADWMLLDEFGTQRRYSASVVIDVYSRRSLIVLSPTPRAETHKLALRLALLQWGVPAEIVTDNGKDYLAKDFLGALQLLNIDHHRTNPFSPWEKPFVERMNQTMLHSILEAYSSFIGHNVAERSAIEARTSFSARLFDKDAKQIEMAMPAHLLQERINLWLAGTYEQNAHEGIGMSPFAKAAAYTGAIQRIEDERALDVLLAAPAGKGTYTLTKKGLTVNKAQYLAMELCVMAGKKVQVYLTDDFGQVVVYHEGKFVCVARCPERTGISRQEIATHARKKQRQHIAQQKKTARMPSLNPDQMVSDILRDKAEAAGKLATLPRTATPYHTEALAASSIAAKTLDGVVGNTPIPEELQAILQRRAAMAKEAEIDTTESNITVIPETPQLRFKKWLELDQLLQLGETIDDPTLTRWYGTYPQTGEHAGLMRRHEAHAENEERNTGATVLRLNTNK